MKIGNFHSIYPPLSLPLFIPGDTLLNKTTINYIKKKVEKAEK